MRKNFGPVKKRNCKAENIQCGGTCLNPTVKTCRLKLSGQVSESLNTAKEQIQKDSFPSDVNNLEVVQSLGGSTGAQLVRSQDGRLYVMKKGAHPDHIREEFTTDEVYRTLGILTPKSKLYETDSGPVKLAEFINGRPLKDLAGNERDRVIKELEKGYVADAVLGNWDVLGLYRENVLVDDKGQPWRIDNGGSLRYRAQGEPKNSAWNGNPSELKTLREMNPREFGGVTEQMIQSQSVGIRAKRAEILAKLPEALRENVGNRIDQLPVSQQTNQPINADTRKRIKEHPEYGSSEQGISQVLGVPIDAAKDYRQAIVKWSRTHHNSMREVDAGLPLTNVQNLNPADVDQYPKYVRDLNEFIRKAPVYDGNIHRGMYFPNAEARDTFLASARSGGNLEINALSSFTSNQNGAAGFAGGSGLLINVRKNNSGVSIKTAYTFQDEEEVVVPKGTKYRLISETEDQGKISIEVEEVE